MVKKNKIPIFTAAIILLGILFSFFQIQNTKTIKDIKFPTVNSIPKDFDVDKTSNIVFTTDGKYREYLKVALKSLVMNKNKDSYYNIYILCVDLKKKEIEEFREFESDRVRINTVELKLKMLRGIIKRKINLCYVSESDLFKFFLPEIFKNLDRILYLDSDIVILNDLSQLYNFNLNNKLIAAAIENTSIKNPKYNCGVILFDLKKCRENKITEKLIEAKNNDKKDKFITQATFGKIIEVKNIAILPSKYNGIINLANHINNIEEDQKDLIIIHFAGYRKPWSNPKLTNAKHWWKYAYMVNPEQKVQKRTLFFCTKDAIATIDNEKSPKENFKNFKNKIIKCR